MKNRKLISCILAVMLLITAIPIMTSAEDLSYTEYNYEYVAAAADHSGSKTVNGTTTTSVIVSRMQYAQATSDTTYQFGVRIYYKDETSTDNPTPFLVRFDIKSDEDGIYLYQGDSTLLYTYQDSTAVKNALASDGLTIAVVQSGTSFWVLTDDGNGNLVRATSSTKTLSNATAIPCVGFGIQESVNEGNTVEGNVYYFDSTNDVESVLDTLEFSFKPQCVLKTANTTVTSALNTNTSKYEGAHTPNIGANVWSTKSVIVGRITYEDAADQSFQLSAVRLGYRNGSSNTFYTRLDIIKSTDATSGEATITLESSKQSTILHTYDDAAAVMEKLESDDGLTVVVVHDGQYSDVWTDDGNGKMVKVYSKLNATKEIVINSVGYGIVNASADGKKVEGNTYLFEGTNDIHGVLEVLSGNLGQTYQFDIADYRGETHSHPDAGGYVFGGWYSDAALTNPIATDTTTGYAYAKWVDNDVLTVKVQFSNPVVDENKKTTIMRIVTSVDSGDYNEVGFDVSTTNASKTYKDSNYFTEIVSKTEHGEVNFAYEPTVFHGTSTKFATVTLYNLKATDADLNKQFTIKPFWETPDGTVVYGITRTVTIQDGIDAALAN